MAVAASAALLSCQELCSKRDQQILLTVWHEI